MLFVVTSSQLCKDDFLTRIDKIASCKPDRIILREKQLSKREYYILAEKCKNICEKYSVGFSVNSFVSAARELECDLHIPITVLKEQPKLTKKFDVVGVSVHSVEESVQAKKLGAKYIIFGHIFETKCKEGLPPRGLELLERIVKNVDIPVFAIGGITAERVQMVYQSGADGVCVMSELMECEYAKIADIVRNLKERN